jgi:hypothetical protein
MEMAARSRMANTLAATHPYTYLPLTNRKKTRQINTASAPPKPHERDTVNTRRQFLQATAAAVASPILLINDAKAFGPRKKLRMAVVTTLWTRGTHSWHMSTRFLWGYPKEGSWHDTRFEVVSAYVDQQPDGDMSVSHSKEFGFPIYPTVAEALRCGGDELAVDAVLLIGEHGVYPTNDIGQKLYPRYELFKQITDVYKKDGKTAPVFNDKHLSWNFAYAKEMVDESNELGFALQAGSSLPVTWRMPSVEMPYGAKIDEALGVAMGPIDIYDFHALEMMQSMIERRSGGETGVASVQGMRGDAVWQALAKPKWDEGGIDPELFEACLSRSQTLAQQNNLSHRYPTIAQMKEMVNEPIAYRIQYRDGTKSTMMLMNGLVGDFNFSAKLKGTGEVISTLFYLPPNPNVVYSAALMDNAEQMFLSGKSTYPIERTLLTSGLVQSCMTSLANNQQPMNTPHLDVNYKATRRSTFWHK